MHQRNYSIHGLSSFSIMAWLVLSGFLISGQIAAEVPASKLFQPTENVNAAPENVNPDIVLRQRTVAVRFDALRPRQKTTGPLNLNLFDDVNFNVILDRVDKHKTGNGSQQIGYTWIGHIDEIDDSVVTLCVTGRKLSGSIELPDAAYQIRNLDSGEHIIREIDPFLANNNLLINQGSNLQADVIGQAAQISDDQREREVFDLVNQERAVHNLHSLMWDDRLAEAAHSHSLDMANNRFFGHTGSDGSSGGDRIIDEGYSWNTWGENIAAYSAPETPQAVMNRWLNSPGHRAAILSTTFCDLGVSHLGDAKSSGAFWDTYWTQNFGREQGVNQCQTDDPNLPDTPDAPDEPDTPNDPAIIDTSFYYRLTNSFLDEGRALDTFSNRRNRPFMATTGNFSGQFWKLTPLQNGYYRLTNLFLGDQRALDTYSNGRNRPFMARTRNVSGQFWKLTPLGNGNFRLTNLFLGEERSLDTYGDGNNEPFMGQTGNFSGQIWKLTKLRSIE